MNGDRWSHITNTVICGTGSAIISDTALGVPPKVLLLELALATLVGITCPSSEEQNRLKKSAQNSFHNSNHSRKQIYRRREDVGLHLQLLRISEAQQLTF